MKNKHFMRESVTGILVIALTVLALVLFALGFSTGYYTFGQMNSVLVTVCFGAAIVLECAALVCLNKFPGAVLPKLITFGVTALLAFGAMTLVGDRVEGIGNCILTDYDSGHGGEEAIYLSLGGALAAIAAMVFNIIGSFGKDAEEAKAKRGGKTALLAAGAVLMVGILIPSLMLGGLLTSKKAAPSATVAANTGAAGKYEVTLSGAEMNLDMLQDYQFQCGKLHGLMNVDSRLTTALTLTLNADGTYSLLSDAYCVEAGKRAVIGDDTGLGMVSTMKAEGTYVVNQDGTVTTSKANHAVFQLGLDTYSSQMRAPASYKLGEEEMADGTYDSAEHPVVLDAVPETVWTLADGKITAYAKNTNVTGTYTVVLSGAEMNLDILQDYQFQCANFAGFLVYDSRFTLDMKLDLDGAGNYKLTSDAYVVESGK
ncbi:MAG: hypothetical protein IJL88_15640, partial [Clostridia bacterium]|nr:hypothetical protein [Clostridia bacterium]